MNAVNNDDANNQTNWPRRKEKKVKKTVQIRDAYGSGEPEVENEDNSSGCDE
jgi:hypothetical protein